jgi:hypothetical protein
LGSFPAILQHLRQDFSGRIFVFDKISPMLLFWVTVKVA